MNDKDKERLAGVLRLERRRWVADTFRHAYEEVRAAAAKLCPSVADLQFRDLRDGAVTRLALSGATLADIALWSGHSLKTIQDILDSTTSSQRAKARSPSPITSKPGANAQA